MNNALLSTGKNDWATPIDFFNKLNDIYHFTLDACASVNNAKCKKFYTEEQNSLLQSWAGETVFCNPPYSHIEQDLFIQKCYYESLNPNTTVVALIPARTDTIRFHKYIYQKAEIIFIKGRLVFEGANSTAPFPNMICVWRNPSKIDTIQFIDTYTNAIWF